MFKTTIPTQG